MKHLDEPDMAESVTEEASPPPTMEERWELARFRQEHEGEQSFDFPEDCYTSGFDLAIDVDSTPHQYAHIAYRYPSGALCGTKLLWFHAGPLTEEKLALVDCPVCLYFWKKRGLTLGGTDPEKKDSIP